MTSGKGNRMVGAALGVCAALCGILGIVGFSDMTGIFWMLSIVLGVAGLFFGLAALRGSASTTAVVGIAGSVIGLLLAVANLVLVAVGFMRQ